MQAQNTELNIDHWLNGKSFVEHYQEYEKRGFVCFENVLDEDQISAIRKALAPHLEADLRGRNNFEGQRTNRVYGLLAKDTIISNLVIHPLVMAFVERELGQSCLLSSCLAINLLPGETAQAWHTDDSHISVPLPRPAWGVSTFWSIDATTELNGATEFLPGSHLWDLNQIDGMVRPGDFNKTDTKTSGADTGDRDDSVKLCVPPGSLIIAKGTVWHRGGANKTDEARLIITPQYCPGWVRQLENMMAVVPPEIAKNLPERVQELIGYSIHPPFMGYVDGVHPKRLLTKNR